MKEQQIIEVREFTRFYTNIIGLLDQHILDSQFSLPEARILYELYQRQPCTASEIMEILSMDRGYMSRIISHFEKKGLIARKKSREDGRAFMLTLTAKGNKAFVSIDQSSHDQVAGLLSPLPESLRVQLLDHMNAIRKILSSYKNPASL